MYNNASTPHQILAVATAALTKVSDSPRLDAEVMLMHLTGMDRVQLLTRRDDLLPENKRNLFRKLVERREKGEPVAYITGEKEFWSRNFMVNPDVLIPRPETEHLIESVLDMLPDKQASCRICDIGTGSGCIAVTLACEYSEAEIIATDNAPAALEMARKNARYHGVDDRIQFRAGDMLAALQERDRRIDILVSNPPYVSVAEYSQLDPGLGFEPREALTDEGDGLRFLATLLLQAPAWLKPKGVLVMECGLAGLPPASRTLWSDCREIRDLAGRLRGGIFQLAV